MWASLRVTCLPAHVLIVQLIPMRLAWTCPTVHSHLPVVLLNPSLLEGKKKGRLRSAVLLWCWLISWVGEGTLPGLSFLKTTCCCFSIDVGIVVCSCRSITAHAAGDIDQSHSHTCMHVLACTLVIAPNPVTALYLPLLHPGPHFDRPSL